MAVNHWWLIKRGEGIELVIVEKLYMYVLVLNDLGFLVELPISKISGILECFQVKTWLDSYRTAFGSQYRSFVKSLFVFYFIPMPCKLNLLVDSLPCHP